MVQTLAFISFAYRDANLKRKILDVLDSKENIVLDIDVHRLWCNARTRYVVITCNDENYLFYCKMIPMRIGYDSLIALINKNWEHKLDIVYINQIIKEKYIFAE